MRLVFPAEALAVRAAIVKVFDGMVLLGYDPDAAGNAQIVVAEVLNNIVEHAYRTAPGEIDLSLELGAEGLTGVIIDRGVPMPHGVLPDGVLPDGEGQNLPEGGFGWYLIRTLARDIVYTRFSGGNCLTFLLPDGQSGASDGVVEGAATMPG